VPLLRRQTLMARAVTRGPVIVALPPAPHPRHDVLSGMDVTRVEVENAAEGMNASIRQAFARVPSTARHAMLLLCDLPDLREEDLKIVMQDVDNNGETLIWRGATHSGKGGHPIVFSRALFADIARLTGDGGARDIVAAAADRVRLVPLPDNRARADLDTPEDWAAWRARQLED
jgi:CTP:molybdopterin cytidylyltransferase MocA